MVLLSDEMFMLPTAGGVDPWEDARKMKKMTKI